MSASRSSSSTTTTDNNNNNNIRNKTLFTFTSTTTTINESSFLFQVSDQDTKVPGELIVCHGSRYETEYSTMNSFLFPNRYTLDVDPYARPSFVANALSTSEIEFIPSYSMKKIVFAHCPANVYSEKDCLTHWMDKLIIGGTLCLFAFGAERFCVATKYFYMDIRNMIKARTDTKLANEILDKVMEDDPNMFSAVEFVINYDETSSTNEDKQNYKKITSYLVTKRFERTGKDMTHQDVEQYLANVGLASWKGQYTMMTLTMHGEFSVLIVRIS